MHICSSSCTSSCTKRLSAPLDSPCYGHQNNAITRHKRTCTPSQAASPATPQSACQLPLDPPCYDHQTAQYKKQDSMHTFSSSFTSSSTKRLSASSGSTLLRSPTTAFRRKSNPMRLTSVTSTEEEDGTMMASSDGSAVSMSIILLAVEVGSVCFTLPPPELVSCKAGAPCGLCTADIAALRTQVKCVLGSLQSSADGTLSGHVCASAKHASHGNDVHDCSSVQVW